LLKKAQVNAAHPHATNSFPIKSMIAVVAPKAAARAAFEIISFTALHEDLQKL
jgi:hypothetical protein